MSTEDNSDRLQQLLEKQQWTEEECLWLLQYLNTNEDSELRQMMQKKFEEDSVVSQPGANADRLLAIIQDRINSEKEKGDYFFSTWKPLMIAASIILVLGMGVIAYKYYTPLKDNKVALKKKALPAADIKPGQDNATLTLSDGSTIVLNRAVDGTLAQQGNSKVLKMKGQISYSNNVNPAANEEPVYNTISTANGNQYQLVLSDGSTVWLNAASSIRFPTAFTDQERRVEITGEAYFEVAPLLTHSIDNNSRQKVPFIVQVNSATGHGYEVQVLGTHFNINAYDDEPDVNTTLMEGSVQIKKASLIQTLKPGQKALLNKERNVFNVQQADTEKAMAWKMNMFEFHDDNLQTIMRQLSRWYDVTVKFNGAVSTKLYNGSIRRQATLSQVLQILKFSGVNYSLDGRTVTISTH